MATEGRYLVDVWHCAEDDRPIHKADWRRYAVWAPDAVEAELIACQMAYRFGHAVESTVIDWPDECASFNGRTAASKSAYRGSNPRARAKGVPVIKALWAAVQEDPRVMRRINGWATVIWFIAAFPICLWLSDSVPFLVFISVYAVVTGHLSTWQACRVEVRQEEEESS